MTKPRLTVKDLVAAALAPILGRRPHVRGWHRAHARRIRFAKEYRLFPRWTKLFRTDKETGERTFEDVKRFQLIARHRLSARAYHRLRQHLPPGFTRAHAARHWAQGERVA